MPTISIIILNYKVKGLVRNCLRTIFESAVSVPYEVIVVDNNSHDNIDEMLAEQFPQVRFVPSKKNLGMGGGNNLGIRAAGGEYVVVLNPDIFLFPDSLQKLYDHAHGREDAGLVAPRLLNPDRTLQYTCYRYHNLLTPIYRRTLLGKLPWARKELDKFLLRDENHSRTTEVDWIQGSCFLVPKKVLEEVGLFDERFFMYFEDTDLCRRIKQAGYKNIYHPECEVIHLHGRQSNGGLAQIFFNKMTRVHIASWVKYYWKWRKGTDVRIGATDGTD